MRPLGIVTLAVTCACAHSFVVPETVPITRPRGGVSSRDWPAQAVDDADRQQAPSSTPARVGPPIVITEGRLANGVRALMVERHEFPLSAFGVVVQRGTVDAPAGAFAVLQEADRMGSRATPNREFWSYLNAFSAPVNDARHDEYSFWWIRSLSTDARGPARLLGELTMAPELDSDKVGVVEKELTAASQSINASTEVNDVARKEAYPAGHPYARAHDQFAKPLGSIAPEELRMLHAALVARDDVVVVGAGDFTLEKLISYFDGTVGTMTTQSLARAQVPPAAQVPARKLVVLDRKSLQQDAVCFAWVGVAFDDPDYVPLRVAVSMLRGGSLNDILYRNGATYEVTGTLAMQRGPSPATICYTVARSNSATSLTAVANRARQLAAQPRPAEAVTEYARHLRAIAIESQDTIGETLATLAQIGGLGLTVDEWNKLLARFNTVTPDDVQRVTAKYLGLDHAVIVMATSDVARATTMLGTAGLGEPEVR
jgi:zinc protease